MVLHRVLHVPKVAVAVWDIVRGEIGDVWHPKIIDYWLIYRTCLKEFDYFRKQKEHALTSAYDTIQFVTKNVNDFTENEANKSDNAALCEFFIKILKVGLFKRI